MSPPDIQAIVFAAGRGSRMTELTKSQPKCLLPIGNKPMIYFPLLALEKADFSDVLIIVPDIYENEVRKALDGKFSSLKIDYLAIPFLKEPGTADSLRQAANANKIKADVLLMSSDVITDYSILKFVNFHRTHDPALTVLVSNVLSLVSENSTVPGRKGKNKLEKDLIAVDSKNDGRLVFLSSEADFEDNVQLKTVVTSRCANIVVHSNYMDTHVYVLKKWVVDFLRDQQQISSIKGELVPLLLAKQFRKMRESRPNPLSAPPSMVVTPNSVNGDIFSYATADPFQELFRSGMFSTDPGKRVGLLLEDNSERVYPNGVISCFVQVVSEGVCVRANTIAAYLEANRLLARSPAAWGLGSPTDPSTPSSVGTGSMPRTPRTQIAADSLVGESSVVGEKVSIKRTIVGPNCRIGDKVKLINSLIMDGSIIEEGATVTGSIVSTGAIVGHSAEIKDCIVADGQTVVALGKLTNETVIDAEHLMQL
ncbi:Translation initiation factor eIF-2B subunit gamma [Halotydeus destructor]|nr:Translation initiation factor eIF-2B subunit gamma [Halotydeus destructor]